MTFKYEPQNAAEVEPMDWAGYEGEWPDPKWPGGAKVCVSFVIHAEAGAESHESNGDNSPEGWLGETSFIPYGALPNNGMINQSSVYEYETARGFWVLLDVFDRYSLPASMFICGQSAQVFPEYVTEAEKRGFELVSENYRFIDYFGLDPAVEAEHASKALQAIKTASKNGTVPNSYYMARPSHLSEGIVVEAFKDAGVEFKYSNCAYGDDLPYYGSKGILYIPMSLDCNDQKFVAPPGFSGGIDFYDHVADAFNCLYREGTEGSPKMMTIALHPRIISRPGRLAYLIKVIEHMKKHDGVWFATRSEIADHWKKIHPFQSK
ncbi:hypothetical protein BCR39DRAFT_334954 [Naematelia encephala]|uniref:NodB homology domain-containing protein n=1 Tax=Naematelia encephala TaxID=71784 RepID=A0A1Y2AP00_9TREE|nr:hypothetical protein BCR39DRAFT_334954 [Naematelia encephala]